jgi:hypothetical protein
MTLKYKYAAKESTKSPQRDYFSSGYYLKPSFSFTNGAQNNFKTVLLFCSEILYNISLKTFK